MDRKGKILVVDDDRIITTLLRSRLSAQGYQVETAGDGQEGLEKCRLFSPDMIILDVLMPFMDGFTFVQEFKKMGDLRQTPIVILTTEDHLQKIFEMEGINDYMLKPFRMADLLRKVDKRMQSKGKKILVVDDEDEILSLIERRLKGSGYDVVTASDGLKGLAAAQRERPDLVVLDVMMPKLDGYHVCRMLKFDERFRDMSVVLLSALSRDQDRSIGREVGADAYLEKPYDGKVLLTTIKELLWD